MMNIGAAVNYNRGFELATGDYFRWAWAAHDDICSPNYLKSCVEKLDSDPSVVLCCPKEIAIDKDSAIIENYMDKYPKLKKLGSSLAYQRFHDLSCLNHGYFMVFGLIRSSALSSTPKIANYIGSDRVILAEFSLSGRFWKSPEPIFFRRHSEQYCALEIHSTRSKLSWPKKTLCYFILIDWLRKKRLRLFKEIFMFIKGRF